MYGSQKAAASTPCVDKRGTPEVTRTYSPRGAVYQQVDPQDWAAKYDPRRVLTVLNSIPRASRRSGPEHNLSSVERRLLMGLALGGQTGLQITAAKAADLAGVDRSNGAKVLRRLGRAGLVLSRGRRRTLDLVIEPDPVRWNLAHLKALRASHSAELSAELSAADSAKVLNGTSRSPNGDGVPFKRPPCSEASYKDGETTKKHQPEAGVAPLRIPHARIPQDQGPSPLAGARFEGRQPAFGRRPLGASGNA